MLYFEKEKKDLEKIYNNEINEIIQNLDYFVKKKSKKCNFEITFLENENKSIYLKIFYIFIFSFIFILLYFRKYIFDYLEKLSFY